MSTTQDRIQDSDPKPAKTSEKADEIMQKNEERASS